MLCEWLEHTALLPTAPSAQKQMKHAGALSLDPGARIRILHLFQRMEN